MRLAAASVLVPFGLFVLGACKGGGGTPAGTPTAAATAAPGVSRLFAVATYDNVAAPLACWMADAKTFKKGKDCNELVSQGTKMRAGTKTVEVTGFADAVCDPTGDASQGISVVAESGTPVVFPEGTALTKAPAADEAGLDVPDAERSRIEAAVKTADPEATGVVRVQQIVRADLDADGKEDTLYSVIIPPASASGAEGEGEDTGIEYPFSGLLLSLNGGAPTVLSRGQIERILVRGLIDLDGDKRPELWLGFPYYEGDADELHRVVSGKLDRLGGWGCGA